MNGRPNNGRPAEGAKRSEIYRFNSNKPLFSAAWSNKQDSRFRLAVGSVVEKEQGNRVSPFTAEANGITLILLFSGLESCSLAGYYRPT